MLRPGRGRGLLRPVLHPVLDGLPGARLGTDPGRPEERRRGERWRGRPHVSVRRFVSGFCGLA